MANKGGRVIDLVMNVSALEGEAKDNYIRSRSEIPFKDRWFFEGIYQMCGEMLSAERRFVYELIKRIKPGLVFEVGTRNGGGSTYFTAQALWENAKGVIHTIEIDKGGYELSVQNYVKYLGYLIPHVCFYCGDGAAVLKDIVPDLDVSGIVTLDGGSDQQQIVDQYNIVLPHMKDGSWLLIHDWNNEKTAKIKPLIEADPSWRLVDKLEAPISVGIVLYQRKTA